MIAVAIVVQRMMPPKMFTSTARTFLSESKMRNASVTCSALAPPPTSRKLAGSPPWQEGEEALADRRGEVQVRFVEDFDGGAAAMDALHDGDAVKHGASRAIPFGKDQDVACAKPVDRSLEFWPTFNVLARCFLRVDLGAAGGAQRAELAIEVLVDGRDTRVADQHARAVRDLREIFT